MTAKTPMLQQYFTAKAEHPGVLLAMRVGDFYEFYGEDAETAASALEITLTAKADGGDKIPMAGVPFHSVERYLARLLQKGYKVAICDQLEDPKTAKGLVKRGITRVMTPGTVLEDSLLESGRNNFLAALCVSDGNLGLAILDPSTGEFQVTEITGSESQERLLQELARLRPTELLLGKDLEAYGEVARSALGTTTTDFNQPRLDQATRKLSEVLHVSSLSGFGCADKPAAITAASMIVAYAERNHVSLDHLQGLATYSVDGFMRLDPATRRSLELTQNLADGSRKYTLLGVLDTTRTPMGARLLRRWVEQPLLDRDEIKRRHDAVARFMGSSIHRGDLRDALAGFSDIERLVSRCSANLAGPRDLAALRQTLINLPKVLQPAEKLGFGRIQELIEQVQSHGDLSKLLTQSIVPEPPHTVRDGGVIREGHDHELDKLRELSRNGKGFIAALEAKERETTGIGNLKIGFNSVFGYFIEVTKTNLDKVPEHYIRKQTTANAERYITAELKDQEAQVLGAEEKATALESDLFHRVRLRVAEHAGSLLQTARAVAEIDVLSNFADVAVQRQYVRPEVVEDDVLGYHSGRHAVVEANTSNFVPNDLDLGEESPRCLIITGPNMAGKSTFLRQTALVTLMAQIGAYVPAKDARVGICDRIFARIGAKDELAHGQSTFMVEMVESANILNHATERSLVILDEVGRGTSTYDGLAIAWAMIEHLVGIRAKTLFATHYHQLNELEKDMPTVRNFRVAVEEFGDEIVWTHRVLPGGADRSYGIHVARMAGVPSPVLVRAQEILGELEETKPPQAVPVTTQRLQMTLFEAERPPVLDELEKVNVNALTPLEALKLLDDWKRKFSG
ncbi:MAG: DNA mismatch repair protein MutS [Armatimonadetes bacterium]|nr:DNA mismatch repair protein MutS [Armatimonadota bacterium]